MDGTVFWRGSVHPRGCEALEETQHKMRPLKPHQILRNEEATSTEKSAELTRRLAICSISGRCLCGEKLLSATRLSRLTSPNISPCIIDVTRCSFCFSPTVRTWRRKEPPASPRRTNRRGKERYGAVKCEASDARLDSD